MQITLIATNEKDIQALGGVDTVTRELENWIVIGQDPKLLQQVQMWSGSYASLLVSLLSTTEHLKEQHGVETLKHLLAQFTNKGAADDSNPNT
jgi:hypothetical protein